MLEVFPLLQPLRGKRAASLSGGEQQATAIGRALMTNPRLLLLDEVSLGLAPVAVEDVYRSLDSLIAEGSTIVLVEQDLTRALRVAPRVVCMLEGTVVLEGAAGELTREQVTDAYFGLGRAQAGGKACSDLGQRGRAGDPARRPLRAARDGPVADVRRHADHQPGPRAPIARQVAKSLRRSSSCTPRRLSGVLCHALPAHALITAPARLLSGDRSAPRPR